MGNREIIQIATTSESTRQLWKATVTGKTSQISARLPPVSVSACYPQTISHGSQSVLFRVLGAEAKLYRISKRTKKISSDLLSCIIVGMNFLSVMPMVILAATHHLHPIMCLCHQTHHRITVLYIIAAFRIQRPQSRQMRMILLPQDKTCN